MDRTDKRPLVAELLDKWEETHAEIVRLTEVREALFPIRDNLELEIAGLVHGCVVGTDIMACNRGIWQRAQVVRHDAWYYKLHGRTKARLSEGFFYIKPRLACHPYKKDGTLSTKWFYLRDKEWLTIDEYEKLRSEDALPKTK